MMNRLNHIPSFQENAFDHSHDPYLYGITTTHLGPVLLISRAGCLLVLGFTDNLDKLKKASWPQGPWQRDDKQAASYWQKISQDETVESILLGTPFQQQIWMALLKIPKGETATYHDIAKLINRPKAYRAVGNAVGANPLSYVIPCHRVIRSDSTLGGYRWGKDIKKKLLIEEKHCQVFIGAG